MCLELNKLLLKLPKLPVKVKELGWRKTILLVLVLVIDRIYLAIASDETVSSESSSSLTEEYSCLNAVASETVSSESLSSFNEGYLCLNLESRTIKKQESNNTEVSNILCSNIDKNDIEELEKCLDLQDREIWEKISADAADKKYLTLHFGVHYSVPKILEKTGLSTVTPPETIHAMARGSLAAGGSFYYADLVVGAMVKVGMTIEPGSNVLDFGSSSGRIIRVLNTVYPETNWYGCDPNENAIMWAKENLKDINFLISPQEPPLPYSTGIFSLVYAISIWSHFAEPAALKWFKEMRRIIKPGGYLLFTTHGYQSIFHYANKKLHSTQTLNKIVQALYSNGYFFMNRFGESGDWGVVNPNWGEAFISPEWWLEHLCQNWRVALFIPGGVEENQDLVVLEAR